MSYALNAPGLPMRDRSLDLTAKVGGIGFIALMIVGAIFYVMMHTMVVDRAAAREAAMMVEASGAINVDAGRDKAAGIPAKPIQIVS